MDVRKPLKRKMKIKNIGEIGTGYISNMRGSQSFASTVACCETQKVSTKLCLTHLRDLGKSRMVNG